MSDLAQLIIIMAALYALFYGVTLDGQHYGVTFDEETGITFISEEID